MIISITRVWDNGKEGGTRDVRTLMMINGLYLIFIISIIFYI